MNGCPSLVSFIYLNTLVNNDSNFEVYYGDEIPSNSFTLC